MTYHLCGAHLASVSRGDEVDGMKIVKLEFVGENDVGCRDTVIIWTVGDKADALKRDLCGEALR